MSSADSQILDINASSQLIVVLTDSWNDSRAVLFRFEKKEGRWVKVSGSFDAVVGEKGMGWGIGIQQKNPQEPVKKEGDRKAPAGTFRLVKIMGYDAALPSGAAFQYEQIKEKTHCVDDVDSQYYNKIINEADFNAPIKDLWKSSEIMKRKDNFYKWLIVVDYNIKTPKPGAGSCIFLHVWRSKDKGTAGCTAIAEKDILELMAWLKEEASPLIVQLPKSVYSLYWKEWKLPPLKLEE